MIHRHSKILDILAERQRVEVITLSDILSVSQVTIRKDLDSLEERGLIRREHGYANLSSMDDIGRRIVYNYDIKRRIAQAAAETVEEGETVMIESGSCCAFLAEELAQAKKDVTIITNSVFIANFIQHASRTKIILLGGYYQPESRVTVGPMTRKCAEIFFSDKFFIGTNGFVPDFGFTGKDHLRAQTVMDLTEKAREIIVLTDSEKFERQGILRLVSLDRVTGVYTDTKINPEAEGILLEKNIALHKVAEKVFDHDTI
ncbi:MAG: DeoR/GlpR family DNA-binding transcription regulator [Treponema sp.]|nr:DeoR/GlpR family DNA-binding transcription regulator [Treponema sp.]